MNFEIRLTVHTHILTYYHKIHTFFKPWKRDQWLILNSNLHDHKTSYIITTYMDKKYISFRQPSTLLVRVNIKFDASNLTYRTKYPSTLYSISYKVDKSKALSIDTLSRLPAKGHPTFPNFSQQIKGIRGKSECASINGAERIANETRQSGKLHTIQS